jgi:hypothetical protein
MTARADLTAEEWALLRDLDRSRFGSAAEGINVQAVTESARSMLPEAIATLERKGEAEDLERYRGFIAQLARRAAEAHREGGVLGIGGKRISDREQAALDEIDALLERSRAS